VDEAEAARRIRSTLLQVETWHRAPLFVPNVGSQLRADDDAWPYMSISQLSTPTEMLTIEKAVVTTVRVVGSADSCVSTVPPRPS
jgi:hypothetical protein